MNRKWFLQHTLNNFRSLAESFVELAHVLPSSRRKVRSPAAAAATRVWRARRRSSRLKLLIF
jgi:hypothetical protein